MPVDRQAFADYDTLPETIKASISRTGYAWLSDEEKARFVEDECLPDWEEDGPQ